MLKLTKARESLNILLGCGGGNGRLHCSFRDPSKLLLALYTQADKLTVTHSCPQLCSQDGSCLSHGQKKPCTPAQTGPRETRSEL